MRIEHIEIQHFRGFPARYEFKLGSPGRNLLVYGENGSGKSSLFKALKGFFEAEKSEDLTSQQSKFVENPEPSVKIEVVGYGESGERVAGSSVYEWSANTQPNTTPLIQAANKTKGCLDYKALLETHYVHRERSEVEIFDLLINSILAEVENPISRKVFKTDFAELNRDKHAHMGYGYRDTYRKRVENFNQGFESVLVEVERAGNELLRGFFDDTSLSLSMTRKLVFSGIGRDKSLTGPKVILGVSLAGREIQQAHDFLNEARLSAVAIALYLGTLLLKPASALRVLVLDDLLIGIDLSNRRGVMRVLQEKFADWQIVLLTHDRVWFETVRMSTLDGCQWHYADLFAGSSHDGVPTPVWRGPGDGWPDDLKRAKYHLDSHDYRAAGVYARAAFEGKLKKHCAKEGIQVPFKIHSHEVTSELLWLSIKNHLKTTQRFDLVRQKVSDVEACRRVVLNPLSHEQPTTLTHAEIADAITKIESIQQIWA